MGAELGFAFRTDGQSRIYNTFDAHRLLHWAGLEGLQYNLKEALFKAYFSDGQDPSDHATLVRIAESVGLDPQRAAAILASDEYVAEVREQEQLWVSRGVTSVPTIVFKRAVRGQRWPAGRNVCRGDSPDHPRIPILTLVPCGRGLIVPQESPWPVPCIDPLKPIRNPVGRCHWG